MTTKKPASLDALVAQDRAIEAEASNSALRLMEHRWKAINEHGYAVNEYAQAIGRSTRLVRIYVKAWELSQGGEELFPADLLEKASLNADTYIAAEAIAKAEGVRVAHVRQSRMPEVRRVREVIAEAPPEQKAERAQRYVEQVRQSTASAKSRREERRNRKTRSQLDLEFELEKARKALQNAVVIAREAKLDADDSVMTEAIVTVLSQVRLLMEQLSMQIAGETGIDWDAELAKLPTEG